MADKTEIQLKAAEKRLDAIERSIENLKKDSNSNDAGAQLKALSTKLEARLDKLDAAVKEINVQMVLKKDLKTATKLEADDWDREAKARQIRSDAEFKASMEKQENARKAAEKEQLAQIDKMVSEQLLNQRFLKFETMLEPRLKILEALVHAKR